MKDLSLVGFAIVAGFVIGFVGQGMYVYFVAHEPLGHHMNDMLRRGAFGAIAATFVGYIATLMLLRKRRG